MTARIHYRGHDGLPLCRQDGWTVHLHVTGEWEAVTCRRCLKDRPW